MRPPRIGIIGAHGAIGQIVARRLNATRRCTLRRGIRHPELVRPLVQGALADDTEVMLVDGTDPESLARFCAQCQVVVNCIGPSWKILDSIARSASAAGADYVDVSGNELLMERVSELDFASKQRVAVLSAGLMPGLSGLLPRFLAQGVEQAERLTVYIGMFDRFTRGAASDYLAGLGQSESRAAWHGGKRLARALTRLVDVELPFFPVQVTAHPYLSHEGERVSRLLGLSQSYWYNVFDGDHVLGMLTRIAGDRHPKSDLESDVNELMQAAALDVAGRAPYQRLLFQLVGKRKGREWSSSLILEGSHAAELTGITAVLAVDTILAGSIAPGCHYASEILDPATVVQALRATSSVTRLDCVEGLLSEAAVAEEGVL